MIRFKKREDRHWLPLGFTLVELLAVIVILGILAMIAVPTIDRTLKDFRESSYDDQIQSIELSAKSWGVDHPFELPQNEDDVITVTLGTLKNGGYVDRHIKNPLTNRYFPNDMLIEVRKVGNHHEYTVIEGSGSLEGEYEIDSPILVLNGASTIYVEINTPFEEPGYSAKTAELTDIPIDRITRTITKDGATVTEIDTSTKGTYIIRYSVTDLGYTTNIDRTVIIRDTIPPIIVVDGHTSNYTVTLPVIATGYSGWLTEEQLNAAGYQIDDATVESRTEYGYQDVASWSSSYNTTAPSDGYYKSKTQYAAKTKERKRYYYSTGDAGEFWRAPGIDEGAQAEIKCKSYCNGGYNRAVLSTIHGEMRSVVCDRCTRYVDECTSNYGEWSDTKNDQGCGVQTRTVYAAPASWGDATGWRSSEAYAKTTSRKPVTRTTYRYLISDSLALPDGSATDNSLETITVTKTGNVVPTVAGTYQVTYVATDSSGNESKLVVTYVFTEASYSKWMSEADLNSLGYQINDLGVQAKEQYRSRNKEMSTTAVGRVSHSCTNRGSCSKSTCITSSTFGARYIDSVTGSCTFRNTYATARDSVRCYIQGNSTTSGWVTITDKSGSRGTYGTTTLNPSGKNTAYANHQFTQLRLCWRMNDQNELSMSGNINNWYTYGAWSNWVDCDKSCPSTSTSSEVEVQMVYRYRLD